MPPHAIDIYDGMKAENKGIDEEKLATDWEYDAIHVVAEDLYRSARMKHFTEPWSINPLLMKDLAGQFRNHQAQCLAWELARFIEDFIIGKTHHT
jgi:hypothetical protein